MADTYGVLAADIAAEMPGLFPVGFTPATKPSLATVTSWISDADTYITAVVTDLAGTAPSLTNTLARLGKRYVIDDVLVRVYRAAYAGKAMPGDIAAMLEGMGGSTILAEIRELAEQMVTGLAASRVSVSYTEPERDLVVDTTDLDPNSGYRGRW